MLSLLWRSLKLNRLTARLLMALLVIGSLLTPPAAVSVQGQGCQQGGTPNCGPPCWAFYNIAWDPQFEQAYCYAWNYGAGAEWLESGSFCGAWSGSYGHSGKFNGPSGGWVDIYQATMALDQPGRDHFSFAYTYKINNDPLNSTQLQVWLRVLENGSNWNWYYVDAVAGETQYCQFREIDLGHHPSWVGHTVLIYFTADLPGASNVIIDEVSLWQSYVQ